MLCGIEFFNKEGAIVSDHGNTHDHNVEKYDIDMKYQERIVGILYNKDSEYPENTIFNV